MEKLLNTHQIIQHGWQVRVYDGEPDMVGRINKLKEESGEVVAETEGMTPDEINALPPEKLKAVAEEAVDTIIAAMGVLSCTGYDFDSLFFKKMETIYQKYNPAIITAFRSTGLSVPEALAATKKSWNGNGHSSIPSMAVVVYEAPKL